MKKAVILLLSFSLSCTEPNDSICNCTVLWKNGVEVDESFIAVRETTCADLGANEMRNGKPYNYVTCR